MTNVLQQAVGKLRTQVDRSLTSARRQTVVDGVKREISADLDRLEPGTSLDIGTHLFVGNGRLSEKSAPITVEDIVWKPGRER